jgi:hypothetical protein
MREKKWSQVGQVLHVGGLCNGVCVSNKQKWLAVSEFCKIWTYQEVLRKIGQVLGSSLENQLIDALSSMEMPREAQSVALRFALQGKNWDDICKTRMPQVWEQVCRELFRAAVEQRQ